MTWSAPRISSASFRRSFAAFLAAASQVCGRQFLLDDRNFLADLSLHTNRQSSSSMSHSIFMIWSYLSALVSIFSASFTDACLGAKPPFQIVSSMDGGACRCGM